MMKTTLKRLVPTGTRPRRLPVGIGRGVTLDLDLSAGKVSTFLGLYEVELNRHLRRLAPRGSSCFDVGAQIGYDALVLAKLTGGPVVTVECEAEAFAQLERNVELNPWVRAPIVARRAFVGDETSADGSCTTLDALVAETFEPDFVKIDVEGAESAVLAGGSRLLARRHPGLLIEVHGREQEDLCLATLAGHGYETTVVDPRRWLPDHRPLAHNRWLVAEGQAR